MWAENHYSVNEPEDSGKDTAITFKTLLLGTRMCSIIVQSRKY